MPVIIDELVISVDVTNQASGGAATGPQPTQDKQAIIEECVERVLDVIEREKER